MRSEIDRILQQQKRIAASKPLIYAITAGVWFAIVIIGTSFADRRGGGISAAAVYACAFAMTCVAWLSERQAKINLEFAEAIKQLTMKKDSRGSEGAEPTSPGDVANRAAPEK